MASNIKPSKVVRSIARWMDTEIKKGKENLPVEQVIQWRDALNIAANNLDVENHQTCRIDVIGFDRLTSDEADILRQNLSNLFTSLYKVLSTQLPAGAVLEAVLQTCAAAILGINRLAEGVARAAPQTPTKTN